MELGLFKEYTHILHVLRSGILAGPRASLATDCDEMDCSSPVYTYKMFVVKDSLSVVYGDVALAGGEHRYSNGINYVCSSKESWQKARQALAFSEQEGIMLAFIQDASLSNDMENKLLDVCRQAWPSEQCNIRPCTYESFKQQVVRCIPEEHQMSKIYLYVGRVFGQEIPVTDDAGNHVFAVGCNVWRKALSLYADPEIRDRITSCYMDYTGDDGKTSYRRVFSSSANSLRFQLLHENVNVKFQGTRVLPIAVSSDEVKCNNVYQEYLHTVRITTIHEPHQHVHLILCGYGVSLASRKFSKLRGVLKAQFPSVTLEHFQREVNDRLHMNIFNLAAAETSQPTLTLDPFGQICEVLPVISNINCDLKEAWRYSHSSHMACLHCTRHCHELHVPGHVETDELKTADDMRGKLACIRLEHWCGQTKNIKCGHIGRAEKALAACGLSLSAIHPEAVPLLQMPFFDVYQDVSTPYHYMLTYTSFLCI